MKFVRLKPYNGKNHKLRSYTVFGIKFLAEKGWYKVDDDVAEYLSTVKQMQFGPDAEYSADAFDIVATLSEAQSIEEREKKKEIRATPENAQKTARVHTPTRREGAVPKGAQPIESFDDMDDTFPEGDMAPALPNPPADALDAGAPTIDLTDDTYDTDESVDNTDEPADDTDGLADDTDESADGLLPQPGKAAKKGKKK